MKNEIFITNDGSHSIYIPEINETYHSRYGAIKESKYIFIEQGFNYICRNSNNNEIRILEIGLGTGLNVLLTVVESLKVKKNEVFYTSLEPFPLTMEEIKVLNYTELINFTDYNLKKEQFHNIFESIHNCQNSKWISLLKNFQFKKEFIKIENFINNRDKNKFDLIYYDAFAPNKQPSMWEYNLLSNITSQLNKNGILITYCSKGEFRRDLEKIGLSVERLKGPFGKRHMTRAMK